MVRAKSRELERARVALRMAETMAHPLPASAARLERGQGIEAGAGREDGAMARGPMAGAPAWYGVEEAYLRGIRRRIAADEAGLDAARRGAVAMAREAWTTFDTSLREMRVMERTGVPLARQAFEVSRRSYESGAASFVDHLQAYWMFVEAEHEAVEARQRASRARAAMVRAVGEDAGR